MDSQWGRHFSHQIRREKGNHNSDGLGQSVSDHCNDLSAQWTKMGDIPVHGDPMRAKDDTSVRVYFENIDGFKLRITQKLTKNVTTNYFNTIMSKLQADIYGGAESQTQWDLAPFTHSIQRVLDMRDGGHCCAAHNIHEKFGMRQYGGTFIAANPEVSRYFRDMGTDSTGLGRWCWMRFEGRYTTTRIVMAYQPCQARKFSTESTMAQQRRYWRLKGSKESPRAHFVRDLIQALRTWRNLGEKILLLMDANEDLNGGRLAKALQHPDLAMRDIIKERSQPRCQLTWIQ